MNKLLKCAGAFGLLKAITLFGGIALVTSCYNNKKDIDSTTLSNINSVSFRDDVVPIMISGACGCHNNGTTTVVPFSHGDTIFYSTIQARAGIYQQMIKGGNHPGEGGIFFTPSQAAVVQRWIDQGAKDNYVPPPITGPVTYTKDIVPIYKTDCKGGSCHGGLGPTLDYATMVANQATLQKMMTSSGATGHPGGTISLSPTTCQTFLAWIAQGMPYQ